MCDPFRQRLPVYYFELIKKHSNFCEDIIRFIMSFINYEVKPITFDFSKFIAPDHYLLEEEERQAYDDYSDDDRYCNGYDY